MRINWNQGVRTDLLLKHEQDTQQWVYRWIKSLTSNGWGLVSPSSSFPVSLSGNILTWGPGFVQTSSGKILEIQQEQSFEIPPLDPAFAQWMVIIQAVEKASEEKDSDLGGNWTCLWWEDDWRVLVISLDEWNNNTLYPPQIKQDCVVLCGLKLELDNTGNQILALDLSFQQQNSAADWEHRNWVGTGDPTVPHALSLNDIGYWQIHTEYAGFVYAGKNPGILGNIEHSLISPSDILVDSTGSITGVAGRRFFYLPHIPLRILGASDTGGNPIAVEKIEGKNIIWLDDRENVPAGGLNLIWTWVSCLEPSSVSSSSIRILGSINQEFVVAGGKSQKPKQQEFNVADFFGFPRVWDLWWDGENVVSSVYRVAPIVELGTIDITVPITLNLDFESKPLILGLTRTPPAGVQLVLKVYGTSGGNSVTELLTFNSSTYNPPPPDYPHSSIRKHLHPTNNTYSSAIYSNWLASYYSWDFIEKIEIVQATSLHSMAWLSINQDRSSDIPAWAPVCKVSVGVDNQAHIGESSILEVIDARKFSNTVPLSSKIWEIVQSWSHTIPPSSILLLFEDFIDVHWYDLSSGSWIYDYPVSQPGSYVSRAIAFQNTSLNSLRLHVIKEGNITFYRRTSTTLDPNTWSPWTPITFLGSNNITEIWNRTSEPDVFKIQIKAEIIDSNKKLWGWWLEGQL